MGNAGKTGPGRAVLLATGGVVLVAGLAMILLWWTDVTSFFRGFGGIAVALAGLLILSRVRG